MTSIQLRLKRNALAKMNSSLPDLNMPEWLARVSAETIENAPVPLRDILSDSLYYPGSGFDDDPIKHLAGNVFSFVYVDYGYFARGNLREDLQAKLNNHGFNGCRLIAQRDIESEELLPRGCGPAQWFPREAAERVPDSRFFCTWIVMQREDEDGVPETHGPRRFSLLYLCADGVPAFKTLYVANKITPRYLAIIQPGTGFGGNWTDFRNPEEDLARAVLSNPAGDPLFLIDDGIGDSYSKSCWPDYNQSIVFLNKARMSGGGTGGTIGVWKRGS